MKKWKTDNLIICEYSILSEKEKINLGIFYLDKIYESRYYNFANCLNPTFKGILDSDFTNSSGYSNDYGYRFRPNVVLYNIKPFLEVVLNAKDNDLMCKSKPKELEQLLKKSKADINDLIYVSNLIKSNPSVYGYDIFENQENKVLVKK